MILKKDFFKLTNNLVFGKTSENFRKHRNTRLLTTEKRRSYLLLEPNYRAIKLFRENLLTIEMRKTQILTNKSVYLGLSILERSKVVMYEL